MPSLNKQRVLITGVSGLLGSNLALAWRDAFQILGIYNNHQLLIEGVDLRRADLLNTKELDETFKHFAPQVIVHCAALADIDACQEDQGLARRMNVEMTKIIADKARSVGSKMVFISTDAVYDGIKGSYKETDRVDPINYYAESKLKAEEYVLTDAKALVVRTSFYGFNRAPKRSLAEWIIHELAQKKTIKGFEDVFSSNIFTYDLAQLMAKAIGSDLSGIYHMACSDALSKFAFAVAIAKEFELDSSYITPVSVDTFPFKAKRAKNLSLNVDKLAKALGEIVVTSQTSISHFKRSF